jgi:hypothetical protein
VNSGETGRQVTAARRRFPIPNGKLAMANPIEVDKSPSVELEELAQTAWEVAKKAVKHRKSLSGDNFYGNKLAELRANATNAFAEMSANSLGDTSAIAELIEAVFSASTPKQDRQAAVRELSHCLRTIWKQPSPGRAAPGNELFPLTIITKTGRGYLIAIAHQMNGCLREGWFDACAVMMRRLLEAVIIEAYESKSIADQIKDGSGNYVQLTALIDAALNEPKLPLSRNVKLALPKLRNVGHRSAHGRFFTAQRSDIEKVEDGVRIAVEEFLHHASLLS